MAPFRLFGRQHLAALAVTGGALAALVVGGRRLGPCGRRRTRNGLLVALWGQEISYHVWKASRGEWSLREMMPLHLCSAVIWFGGPVLLHPTPLRTSVLWAWGTTGAPIALSTPDIVEWSFPHYRFLQFFASHGLIFALPLWNTLVEGRRPTLRGAGAAYALLVGQAAVAAAVNHKLGSNYLFIGRKTSTPSLQDWMPPWPHYIPLMAAMAGAAFVLVTLPLAERDA